MSLPYIQSALTELWVYVNTNHIPGGPIATAYPNVNFTPPAGSPWAAFFVSMGGSFVGSLGTGGLDDLQGFVIINLNYPVGDGVHDILSAYDAIRDGGFKAGNYLEYSGQSVLITNSAEIIQQPTTNGTYLTAQVRAEWFAQIQR